MGGMGRYGEMSGATGRCACLAIKEAAVEDDDRRALGACCEVSDAALELQLQLEDALLECEQVVRKVVRGWGGKLVRRVEVERRHLGSRENDGEGERRASTQGDTARLEKVREGHGRKEVR